MGMANMRGTTIIRTLGLLFSACLAGFLAYFSFAPYSHSLSMVAAVFLFEMLLLIYLRWEASTSCVSRKLGFGFVAGYLWGLSLYLPLYVWISEFVETVPWIALSLLIALFNGFIGLFLVLIGVTSKGRPNGFYIGAVPVVWSVVEIIRLHFPFGGFPWGSPAFSQTTNILGSASLWGSTTAVTYLTVLCATVLTAGVWLIASPQRILAEAIFRAHVRSFVAGALVLLTVVTGSWAYETSINRSVAPTGTLKVAYVQGDVVTEGIDFNSIRMQVLQNHALATHRLAFAVWQGRVPQPDVVVWPENSADVDPLGEQRAGDLITEAARAIQAPILVGAVLGRQSHNPELNAVLLWTKDGYQGQRHVKRHIQPFGEYLPWRSLIERISPYAVWAGNFVAGDGDGVIKVANTEAGIATCYEVIFNDSLQRAVNAGAQWLAVPTNNATFGRTNQTYQQLEMARFRARELHRWVVSSATSGVSAYLTPTGEVIDATALYTQAFAVRSIPLFTVRTAAPQLSIYVDLAMCAGTILVFSACVARVLRQRRRKL